MHSLTQTQLLSGVLYCGNTYRSVGVSRTTNEQLYICVISIYNAIVEFNNIFDKHNFIFNQH